MADASPHAGERGAAGGHMEKVLPAGFLRLAVSGLDFLLAVYLVGLALVALTGGVDFGVVSVRGATKPLLVPLSSNALEGLGRYASVLFPVFMLVGSTTSLRVHEAIVIVCLVFHTLFVCFFVTWQPIY